MAGVKTFVTLGFIGIGGLAGAGGCVDRTPPPPNAAVPDRSGGALRSQDPVKPLPRPGEDDEYAGALPPPPFNDVPLVNQDTPEQRAFIEAYNAVGRPRIVVFVNRTLEGELVPVNPDDPVASVERTRTSRGDVNVETRDRRNTDAGYRDRYGRADVRDDRDTTDRYESRGGPGELRDRTDVYLRPGQYDEVAAKSIDYEAVETVLTDWLSAGGRAEIVSPVTARQRLTDEQVRELQAGRPRVTGEIAQLLDADVLVQVTARPTRQTPRGLEVRLVAESINVRGGQSIGRAVVDVPAPLDKPRINKFTRFLARVLMDRMIGTWENTPPPRGAQRREATRPPEDGRAAPQAAPPLSPGNEAAPANEPQPGPRIESESPDSPEVAPAPELQPGPRAENAVPTELPEAATASEEREAAPAPVPQPDAPPLEITEPRPAAPSAEAAAPPANE